MSAAEEGKNPPVKETQDNLHSEDQAKLDLAIKLRNYHHNAIWEEQKHFTWLLSNILSAQLIALTGVRLDKSSKVALILIASLVGALLSITAFRVQRKEGNTSGTPMCASLTRTTPFIQKLQ